MLKKSVTGGIILLFLLSSLIPMTSSDVIDDEYDDDYYEWDCRIDIIHNWYSSKIGDWVIFGESTDANDGPPKDDYDSPHPPTPPPPFGISYFNDGLEPPFNKLYEDFRRYPDVKKIWNLTFFWDNAGYNYSHNFTFSWEKTKLNNSEYDSVFLKNLITGEIINMKETESIYRSIEPCNVYNYKILCGLRPLTLDFKPGWNFISNSFNKSINKNNITVNVNEYFYDWNDAVTNGIVYDFIFGWDRTIQSYYFSDELNPGYGYWIYSEDNCEFWCNDIQFYYDDYITSIKEDWNIISIPYNQSLNKTEILVNNVSWTDAVTSGLINDFVFGWDRNTQSYTFADMFMPGYAYWVYAYQNCTLKRGH